MHMKLLGRVATATLILATLSLAAAQAAGPITIKVTGSSSVANTAAFGTVVDALMAFNSSGGRISSGVSWSINNPDFYTDFFGDLHTAWNSEIAPGPQGITVTVSAPGYTASTLPLTVTVTGTLALQTMLVTASAVESPPANAPPTTIVEQLVVSQTNGELGNLGGGVTWTCDNPNFRVVNTNTNAGTYYLVTTWNGTIAAGPETVHLTSSAPDYTTADSALTVQVLAPSGS
jgi:hypothetical protein